MKNNQERKGFFVETWKEMLLIVYISSVFVFLISLSLLTSMPLAPQGYSALTIAFIMECSNLVIYPCNYAHLVKKEKIRFSFFSFMIGLFPIVACIIGEILLWIYMN